MRRFFLTRKAVVVPASLCLFIFCCSIATAQDNYKTWVQQQNIPSWVRDVFLSKQLNKHYEFSFHLNPFYLRGDFNGDNKPDIAILLKERRSGKIGIGIFHAGNKQVLILGAGESLGKRGDDFRWMNVWSVYPKGPVHKGVGETSIPTLRGEALLVEKSESASALIYWDGKQYAWYQQGD